MIVLGAIVTYFGFDLVARNYDLEATTMPLSMAWMYIPLIPAGLVTTLQAAVELAVPTQRPLAAAPVNESAVE